MKARVLFFPWSAGGGAGYTGRGLAAAGRLGDGFVCAFGPSAVAQMVAEAGYPIVGLPGPEKRPERVPAFLPFANVERVYAVAARYYRTPVVTAHLRRDLAAIDEFRPDIVVTDMQPTAVLAARIRGLPVLSLADTDFLSSNPLAWMPWSAAAPSVLLPHPEALPVLNEVAAEHGLAPVGHVSELLWGDRVLVPSAPEVEPPVPPPAGHAEAVYVGPLYWDPPGAPYQPVRRSGTRHVYVSLGSGAMIGERALREVLAALDRPGVTVFLSAGMRPAAWMREFGNVEVGGFTGITGPIRWADLVFSHGGYSTVIAALAHGRPQLVLPSMSEQEANGRAFLAAHGAGLVARTSQADPVTGALVHQHRHGAETTDPVTPAAALARTVDEAFAEERLAHRAAYAQAALAREQAAADLPELFRSILG
ncbi:glycosyltransferase [Micromonospora inyonensis]|uniref:Glycosyltransferase family 28 C-terminal domain-containing protein n=1 Tax=Micromonospora inyonensis TaxID=47866 RepID=A0A1C6RLT3_9ACTN|nr:glycosyltransferase [Micromonospora inyonensis]SCL18006.1 Glycosyltransferase family 28 C-terminal domain-containing protein [Micromonospora inyonensis]